MYYANNNHEGTKVMVNTVSISFKYVDVNGEIVPSRPQCYIYIMDTYQRQKALKLYTALTLVDQI